MFKRLMMFMVTLLFCGVVGYADVSVDSADRIFNKHTPVNPTDHSALNADLIMVMFDGVLNGKYHVKPVKRYATEFSLLSSTAEMFECAGSTDTQTVWMWLYSQWVPINPQQVINLGIDDADSTYLGALSFPTKSWEHSITISSITFCTDAGTVTGVDVKYVSDATPFASGTSILGGTINVGTGGKYGASSISTPSISSGTVLRVESSGTTGSPTKLWGRIIYRITH